MRQSEIWLAMRLSCSPLLIVRTGRASIWWEYSKHWGVARRDAGQALFQVKISQMFSTLPHLVYVQRHSVLLLLDGLNWVHEDVDTANEVDCSGCSLRQSTTPRLCLPARPLFSIHWHRDAEDQWSFQFSPKAAQKMSTKDKYLSYSLRLAVNSDT